MAPKGKPESKVSSSKGKASTRPAKRLEKRTHAGGEGYRVLLYNDELHTQEEVVIQLRRALSCPLEQAIEIMLRAHTNGKAVVTITTRDQAQHIAKILREIALVVRVDRV